MQILDFFLSVINFCTPDIWSDVAAALSQHWQRQLSKSILSFPKDLRIASEIDFASFPRTSKKPSNDSLVWRFCCSNQYEHIAKPLAFSPVLPYLVFRQSIKNTIINFLISVPVLLLIRLGKSIHFEFYEKNSEQGVD